MKCLSVSHLIKFKLLVLFLLLSFVGFAQDDIKVEIIGGSVVYQYQIIKITAGNSITFRIESTRTNCGNLRIENIILENPTDFMLSHSGLPANIKPSACKTGDKYFDFTVTNTSDSCSIATDVIIELNSNNDDFIFKFTLDGSPEINVLGGNPFADIYNTSTTTSATNGTFFGVVEEGKTVTRNFIITSTGSCPLDVTLISSSLSDFAVVPYVFLPNDPSPTGLPQSIDPGSYIIFVVTFTAPNTDPNTIGKLTSTISISNSDNTTFTFDVSAEMFDFKIPGPGGITADFRLWLKATRGITKDIDSKVSKWADIGTNGKDAIQPTTANQPTYLDNSSSNINFNPVLKFENDGGSLEQYLYNDDNGFYSQDIFIVMVPDADMTSASSRNTIFSGISSGSPGDITGVGFGDYSSRFTNEVLSYNQDIESPLGSFNGEAEINSSYSNAGIINIRNNAISPTGQDILYNSNILTTSTVEDISFENVGYTDVVDPFTVFGTEYWIGRNFDVQGSLNGRVAEIFTFAERVPDAGRQKIESYLAIKYGITLGTSTEAQKDYINSFGTKVWDITANNNFNYYVAGIGRDSISDLNQKQSKTLNTANEVTIGLNGIFATNSSNTNEFKKDGDFLVWGCDNGAYSGANTNTVTIASGIVTSLTRIDRKWKIVESTEASGDVENVYVSIPLDAFSSFNLAANEEYVLIVADDPGFTNADIIDVLPLKSDINSNLQTWYDFDGTKYFTFGKAPKLSENHSISIAAGDYLVGEYALNLNINAFTISAWVKANSLETSTRTIMAKGSKLQLRLNNLHQIEVMVDDDSIPRFTSNMLLNDDKWHQITFVYNSGTIFLYVDGVLDKSEQNVVAPSPNYNNFSIGALYVDKSTISNPFLGEIDEVYVWDQGLSTAQVRYLMNQEIVKGTDDFVSGKLIPQISASNEVAAIPWSQLRGYYDFNSFCGSTVESLSDGHNYLRIRYLDNYKTIADDQTTPLPYVSSANGEWSNPATWSYDADQNPPNYLSLDGVTYIDWNIVEINHDITSGDKDITVLGLISNSGTLTIADPADTQDETNSGQGLTITHYLELDGVIDLVGESQLVQTEGSIVDADSGGYIERDQQGTANSFNYNYWSSSVSPITGNTSTSGLGVSSTNSNYTLAGILFDGSDTDAYNEINFNPSGYAADSSTPSSPVTISSRWLYKFYGPENSYSAWAAINEFSALLPGEGFTMKGTSGSADILNDFQNYVFKGLPNNGDIILPLNKSSDEVSRLVGNPYPSAINATDFILDNLSIADGGNNPSGTVFNGALYFWDHFGEENSHLLKAYVGGYATRNLTGGVAAISNDALINNTSDNGGAAIGTKVPGEYIPVNQGFFVSTALDGFDNGNGDPISSVIGGNVIFKNSQRAFVPEDEILGTSLFMKSSKDKKTSNTNSSKRKETKNPLIRLVYDSPSGYHRQIALGSNKNASDGFDLGYDAFMADVNQEDMYWIFNNNKFVIQAVNDFNNHEFLLGLIVKKSGLATIRIDTIENMDSNMEIYILDVANGKTYQIGDKPFEIYLEAGVYDQRFKIVFQASTNKSSTTTKIDNLDLANKTLVYFDRNNSRLNINVKDESKIFEVVLYNIMGQKIVSVDNVQKQEVSIPIQVSSGAYVVKISTANGAMNKKIILD